MSNYKHIYLNENNGKCRIKLSFNCKNVIISKTVLQYDISLRQKDIKNIQW